MVILMTQQEKLDAVTATQSVLNNVRIGQIVTSMFEGRVHDLTEDLDNTDPNRRFKFRIEAIRKWPTFTKFTIDFLLYINEVEAGENSAVVVYKYDEVQEFLYPCSQSVDSNQI